MDSGPLDPDPNAIPKVKAPREQNQNQRTAQNRKKENTDSGTNTIPKKVTRQESKRKLKIGTWNVRHGLIRREHEIVNLIESEEVDILFLTETDTRKANASIFKLPGYETFTQSCEGEDDIVRVIAIVNENCGAKIQLRPDLMSNTFPSVWLEVEDRHKSKSLIAGFYRQWSVNGKLSVPAQIEQINEFGKQIDTASSISEKIIITGDANLCADKWQLVDYDRKSVAQPLLDCLMRNGLKIQNIGATFQADFMRQSGTVTTSALDHVYSSDVIEDCIKCEKMKNSSSDHLPVMVSYNLDTKKVWYKRSITKRSFKNFTKEKWNASLAAQDWLDIEDHTDVDLMVRDFNAKIKDALDLVAPVRTFKIKSNHKFGLSDGTKEQMRKRDRTRESINRASPNEKVVLLQQYKKLRNKVTSMVRKEIVDYNNNRIEQASNERELWNVANEVLNPRKKAEWSIINKNGDTVIEDEDVSEAFNEFFINKVEELKKGIDVTKMEDPLARLKERLKKNTSTLEFKIVTRQQLLKHLKKLSKKKSSGIDGLSQENLLLGTENLAAPLTAIVNQSIAEGKFPTDWKEASVTPVLKKGDPQLLNNYRPVSCLPAASKVLEIVVCSQLSEYLESNNLLPSNQHGFRPRRSTMSAWHEIQLDWAMKGDEKLVTGVLLWDLSAAFDTLDCEGVCAKLKLFGLQERSVNWVRSFLTNRSQRVKIGKSLSSYRPVPTGVPQGGVLSPLVFVTFVSDLQDWLQFSTAPTYADDTTTGTSSKTVEETIRRMEIDAEAVLRYMATNGLVANASKTSFLLLGAHNPEHKNANLKIGSDVLQRETSAKLLGVRFQDDLLWKEQIYGKGGVLSALNSRHYIIRRLMSHVSLKSSLKLVDGLFTSKIRYGLQLTGRARMTNEDPECAAFKAIQTIQNNLMRTLNGTKTRDKISIKSLLKKFGMLSVNQINASIKLLEIWKALNDNQHPLKIKRQAANEEGALTRAAQRSRPMEMGGTNRLRSTAIADAITIWNKAPPAIQESKTIYQAKKAIKTYVNSLPI